MVILNIDVMEIYGVLVHVYGQQITAATTQHLLPHFAQTLANLKSAADYEIRKLFWLFTIL